jgi:hypothetical protein
VPIGVLYFYICLGPVGGTAYTSIEVGLNTCAAQAIVDTLSAFVGGYGGGGSWGPGGGGIGPGVSGRVMSPPPETEICDGCKDGILKALFKCGINFIPLSDVPKCIVSIASAAETAISSGLSEDTAMDAGGALLNCLKAAGKEIPVLGTLLDIIGCIKGIGSCLGISGSPPGGGGGGGGLDGMFAPLLVGCSTGSCGARTGCLGPQLLRPNLSAAQDTQLRALLEQLEERVQRIEKIIQAYGQLFGNEIAWLETKQSDVLTDWLEMFTQTVTQASQDSRRISDAERAELLNAPLPSTITPAMAHAFLDRWNRSIDYWRAGIFNSDQVPAGQNPDFLAMDVLLAKAQAAKQALEQTTAEGYEDVLHALQDTKQQILDVLSSDGGVCTSVRIRIDQEAVITRAAFLGTLEIDNGNQSGSMEGIRVELDIRDQQGQPAGDKFAVRGPTLDVLTAVDGTGSLPALASGSAKYTIIPNREAAPEGPTIYRIGGTLRYIDPDSGAEVVAPLLPATITVYPDPVLEVHYFQQRDVFADDPFTDPIEPSEPFSLGLLVKNVGKGVAKNFTITSGQPKIVENEKGLLIDFKIIGTQVGNQQVEPTLTANLGSIDPGKSQVAQFVMISSLQGHFTDYDATFEHIDGLGDPRLSLIDSVEIHELIRVVRADRPGDDDLMDFLVNDVPDPQVVPDTLYMSDGTVAVVNAATGLSVDGPASFFDRQVVLSGTFFSGWNYSRLPDPGGDFRLDRVVRSDGKELLAGVNAWQTHTTFTSGGFRREDLLHLFDHDATGLTYTLYYKVNDSIPPTIESIAAVVPNPRNTPVTSIDVSFSELIDLDTFDHRDLSLTLNGGPNRITDAVTVTHVSGTTYRIAPLDALTNDEGNYELTVIGGGIEDFGGNPATNSLTTAWARSDLRPVVVSVGPVAPDPRNTVVATVDVVFSKPIDPDTFGVDDLSLSHNGTEIGDLSGISITAVNDTTYRLSGLTDLTAAEGSYQLTVHASGILDGEGNSGTGSRSDTWIVDTTRPRVTAIEPLATNPRNIVVLSLDVTLSEPIRPATFDYRDLTLTRNDGPNLITSDVLVSRVSDTIYRISNFNWVVGQEGTYRMTVSGAGLEDLAGNAGVGTVVETWIMDTTRPASPTNLRIEPDRGVSASDGQTNTGTVTILGDVASDVVEVVLFDLTTATDLEEARPVDGQFSKILSLTPGQHRIRVRAIDAAANTNAVDSFFDIFVDLTPPTVSSLSSVTPDPRTAPVDTLDVTFSESLDPASFDRFDLSLTRDGNPVLLPEAVHVAPLGDSTKNFRIHNLADLTAAPGDYVLAVHATGVEDMAGNAGTGFRTASWTILPDTLLTVREVVDIVPDPRRWGLTDGILVVFSEPILPASFGATT